MKLDRWQLAYVALGSDYYRGECLECHSVTYVHKPTTGELQAGIPCHNCNAIIDSFGRIT